MGLQPLLQISPGVRRGVCRGQMDSAWTHLIFA